MWAGFFGLRTDKRRVFVLLERILENEIGTPNILGQATPRRVLRILQMWIRKLRVRSAERGSAGPGIREFSVC